MADTTHPDTPPGFQIALPEWCDDAAIAQAYDRGYLADVQVVLSDGRRYLLDFRDPGRLKQDLQVEVDSGNPCIAEPGLVVIPEITISWIERAVDYLVKTEFFDCIAQSEGAFEPGQGWRMASSVPSGPEARQRWSIW